MGSKGLRVRLIKWLTYVCSVAYSCQTLHSPIDCSPPGSSVHGNFQARILEWVATSYSRDLSTLGINPASLASPALAGIFFTNSTTWRYWINIRFRIFPGNSNDTTLASVISDTIEVQKGFYSQIRPFLSHYQYYLDSNLKEHPEENTHPHPRFTCFYFKSEIYCLSKYIYKTYRY